MSTNIGAVTYSSSEGRANDCSDRQNFPYAEIIDRVQLRDNRNGFRISSCNISDVELLQNGTKQKILFCKFRGTVCKKVHRELSSVFELQNQKSRAFSLPSCAEIFNRDRGAEVLLVPFNLSLIH